MNPRRSSSHGSSPRPMKMGGDFAVILPDNWLPLELAGGERIAAQVESLLTRGAALDAAYRSHRGLLERQIRAVLRGVRQQDVAFAAMHATVVDDVLPVLATMTVAVRDAAGAGLAGMLDIYGAKPGYLVDVVGLRWAGDAVRLQFTDRVADPSSGVTVEAVMFQWLIPVPGDTRVTMVTFASPNTEPVLVDGMADLFAAIADTFEYIAPAEGGAATTEIGDGPPLSGAASDGAGSDGAVSVDGR
jgi:hypothetical protein